MVTGARGSGMGVSARGGCAGLGSTRRLRTSRIGLAGLIGFCLWTGMVRSGWSDLLSNPLDRVIRSVHSSSLGRIDHALSLLGTPVVSLALVVLLCGLIARRDQRQSATIIVAFGAGLLVEAALKRWLFYPVTGSYPSGHALRALFLALIAARFLQRRSLAFGLIAIAIAVGLSRISVGDHFSDEVLGGWLLGWSLALVSWGAPRRATATASARGRSVATRH